MKIMTPFPLRTIAPMVAASLGLALWPTAPARAADHGDAPAVDQDSAADIADCFLFLDPNDNSQVVIAMTVHGFLVPGEALNFANFDPKVHFVMEIENTGDARVDSRVHFDFDAPAAPGDPQTAHIHGPNFDFTAPTTPPTIAPTANAQVVTADPGGTGVKFFAGPVTDPFFFDLVAFDRFVASVKAGAADPTVFERGRNTFAGYNVLAIALEMPVSFLKGSGPKIGLDVRTKRRTQTPSIEGGYLTAGSYVNVDRMGNPAVNIVLIPFKVDEKGVNEKDAYNAASTKDDAAGKFASDIVTSLETLGTNSTNIGLLAGIAVTNGDFLRMDPTVANSGTGGGDDAAAAFPNGRRLKDAVINTLLTVITNGGVTDDGVDSSDVSPEDAFPFFALPHQPLATGATDPTEN